MLPEANRFRYEYMHLDILKQILERYPLVIQPTGLLEWHGGHNALGLDGILAYHICERAINIIGDGVLMPLNWVGTYGFRRYEGTVCYDEATAREVFVEMFRELGKIGFKLIAIISGHGGHWQETQLRDARQIAEGQFHEQKLDVRLLAMTYPAFAPHVKMGSHAKEGETSMLWRLGQIIGIKLVDPAQFQTSAEKLRFYHLPDDDRAPRTESPQYKWSKKMTNPAACNPELGEKLISAYAEAIALELQEYMNELGIRGKKLER